MKKSFNRISLVLIFTAVFIIIFLPAAAMALTPDLDEEGLLGKDALELSKVEKLNKLVSEYIEKELKGSGKMSVTYYDIITGEGFAINGDAQYHPASTSKLYAVITLYDLAHAGQIDIDSTMRYSAGDYESGTGILQGMNRSVGYSFLTLADYAMIYSDNIAYRMIRRGITHNSIRENYQSIIGHVPGTDPRTRTMTMSSNNALSLLKKVYYNEDSNYLYDRMIENMKNTVFDDRIAKYLPKEIVAHKIGTYGGNVHDTAIVYSNQPYILTVFTNGIINADEKIAQISEIIYDNHYDDPAFLFRIESKFPKSERFEESLPENQLSENQLPENQLPESEFPGNQPEENQLQDLQDSQNLEKEPSDSTALNPEFLYKVFPESLLPENMPEDELNARIIPKKMTESSLFPGREPAAEDTLKNAFQKKLPQDAQI